MIIKDILTKLRTDRDMLQYLLDKESMKNGKVEIETKLDYAMSLIEWIEQEGMV